MILPLLAALALVIAAAKIGGWASARLGQPVVLGSLISGLFLGPSVVNVFGVPYFQSAHVTQALSELGELGVIFLMFTAGLEIQFSDLVQTRRAALLAGALGVIVPLGLGAAVTLPFGYDLGRGLFIGIVMAATSVSISAQTLMELGRLRSREGLTLLGAAVVDDVLAIAALSIFVAVALEPTADPLPVVWILVRMVLFLVGAFLLGSWLLPRAVRWLEDHDPPISEPVTSLVIVVVLLFAWASEFFGGVAVITGAFIAGVALATSPSKERIERGIHAIAYAFFVPIFLIGIGLKADARALSPNDLGLAGAIVGVAIVSKPIGAGLGARLGGMSWPAALRVGIGMISRGEVGLIVASIGVNAGLIGAQAFTAVVLMVLVTTLVTPPLLRLVFGKAEVTHARNDRARRR
jgi:Kef-type K+ transport system membrane component KefB